MVIEYNMKSNNRIIKCVEFDGLIDQINYIKEHINNNIFNCQEELDIKDNFHGKHSLKETLEGMMYGFKDSTDYFLNTVVELNEEDYNNNGLYMDVEGFAYDMANVVNGIPECCLNSGCIDISPYIKIMIDISFPCMYTAQQIYNRGIAITNLINTLLLNNCIVDLYIMRYNHQYDQDIMYTLKIDTQTLSIANIAFMCTPDYFRKIAWITTDVIRGVQSEPSRGNSTILNFMLNSFKKNKVFFIGGGYSNDDLCKNLNSLEDTNNYLIKMFNKYCKENEICISLSTIDN